VTTKKNGGVYLRGFSDVLKEKMLQEVEMNKAKGGPLTTYRKVIEDALAKRYAGDVAVQRAEENRQTEETLQSAKLDTDESFLG
jgi:hypothetical protein